MIQSIKLNKQLRLKMSNLISFNFWTPIQYENQHNMTLGQRIAQEADSYFNFGNTVAVVMPRVIKNGSVGVKLLQKEQTDDRCKTALKVASYFTGVLPASMFAIKAISRAFYPFHMHQRTLSNGIQETGIFAGDLLMRGVRIKDGQRTFIDPKLLMKDLQLEEENIALNFAEVEIDGQKQVIPVQKPYEARHNKYVPYSGLPNEALLKIAQEMDIKFILEHADNHLLQTREFLTYLLTPNDHGKLPIYTVSRMSLLEILELVKQEDIPSPQTVDLEILFSKWAGTGNAELTRALLAIDPTVIKQTEGREESFFIKAVLGGHEKEAQVLWQAMQEQQVTLTPADQWIHKAFTDDCNFTKKAFLQLPSELQNKLFQIANSYISKKFLLKLRNFGMRRAPAQPEEAALFSYDMDAIDVGETLQHFLGNLRREGLLLTQKEFKQKDQNKYFNKGCQIGRILGRNYIERTATALNLPYIKVPKKTAVIQTENANALSLEFTVSKNMSMDVECRGLRIYAEKIEAIDRKTTRKEMLGLLDLIQATRFSDFIGDNLFMGKNQRGEEGIYFIDTEYTNFHYLPFYHEIETSLCKLMGEKDHQWLDRELKRRFGQLEQQNKAREQILQKTWEIRKPIFNQHGFADRRKPFTIAIESFVYRS